LFLPMRIEQLFLEQVTRDLLDPRRLDVRDAAAEEARRFDQLRAGDPAARALLQVRAGMREELDAARAEIRRATRPGGALLVELAADVAQQPGEHRLVQVLVTRGRGV